MHVPIDSVHVRQATARPARTETITLLLARGLCATWQLRLRLGLRLGLALGLGLGLVFRLRLRLWLQLRLWLRLWLRLRLRLRLLVLANCSPDRRKAEQQAYGGGPNEPPRYAAARRGVG